MVKILSTEHVFDVQAVIKENRVVIATPFIIGGDAYMDNGVLMVDVKLSYSTEIYDILQDEINEEDMIKLSMLSLSFGKKEIENIDKLKIDKVYISSGSVVIDLKQKEEVIKYSF